MSDSFMKIMIVTFTVLAVILYLFSSRSTDDRIFGFADYKNDPINLISNKSDVNIIFDTPQNILEMYSGTAGKSDNDVLAFSQRDGKNCNIYTLKPDSWNDERALAMLGHEVLHCLGAVHS